MTLTSINANPFFDVLMWQIMEGGNSGRVVTQFIHTRPTQSPTPPQKWEVLPHVNKNLSNKFLQSNTS